MTRDGKVELWEELAELASHEEDSETLLALVAEINRLLDGKDRKDGKDGVAKAPVDGKVSEEIARLLKEKKALLNDGSTEPDTK